MKDVFKKFLEYNDITDVNHVRDVVEETVELGHCETCEYEYTVLVVEYVDNGGATHTARIDGNFADLLNQLLSLEEEDYQ